MTSPKTTTTTSGKDSKADCVEEELKQFDFVQFCVPDIHGIPRGKLVPCELLGRACRDGVGIFSGRSLAHSNRRVQARSRGGRLSWAQKVGLLLLQLFLSSCATNIVTVMLRTPVETAVTWCTDCLALAKSPLP